MELKQDKDGRYYDANRYDGATVAEKCIWWVAILGDDEIPNESELDVWARDYREARATAKAAVAADFDEGTRVTKVVVA